MKVIVNADDCGINPHVNQHIKDAIEAGKLTSTTIMANMADLDGAFELYERYHKYISFGAHLNLTEGTPIIASKTLLDFGYYVEKDDQITFDGDRAEYYHYKYLPRYVRDEIYKELSAQLNMIQKTGVMLSHLDSHHHIHTSFSLKGVMAQLSKEYNIHKVRRIRNYVPLSASYYGRQVWAVLSRLENRHYVMTDFFAIFKEFFNNDRLPQLKPDSTIELMIHPGHHMESYQKEEYMMMDMKYPEDFELINYNQL